MKRGPVRASSSLTSPFKGPSVSFAVGTGSKVTGAEAALYVNPDLGRINHL